jgi:NAD(P)-dependent dehydrogenase (short-subunit alcohol dehydrogenase family)
MYCMGYTTIVTGASRGIGRAIASRLAGEGHTVINLSRTQPGKDFPGPSYLVDLADADALNRTLRKLISEHSVDNLVNNAAPGEGALLDKIKMAELDLMVDVNLRAPILLAQAIVPGMRAKKRGRIVNIGSRAALGKSGLSVYGAVKGSLVAITRTWALELAGDGITVNTVSPGPVATDMFNNNFPPDSPATKAFLAGIPVGRIGSPDDIAAAVNFLLSDEAAFITGQTLHVCGGLSITGPI